MTETKMQLVDWLDDLCVRFIVNLPKEELESVERICFQVEEAQWFYEDFVRPLDPNLPSMNLRQFCLRIFQHCPLLSGFSPYHHSAAFSEFLAYKTRVPVRGAIMLNEAMDAVVLVKGWKKNANWSFPRGKINKDEKDIHCAIREVYEETGYDIRTAGLAANEDSTKYIEMTMREQHMRLYVFRGVPMDTFFEPRTRKEISKIQWYKLSELPTLKKKHQQDPRGEDVVNANKFYMVAPFLVPLKKWISQQRKQDALNGPRHLEADGVGQAFADHPADPVADHPADQPASINQPEATQDNMGRLLSQLRQSGQASRENLPEVSGLPQANGSSAQLKTLLKVPEPTLKSGPEILIKRKTKANAMLSLLRSSFPTEPQQYLGPQTPADQIILHPEMPAPPKVDHARQSREVIPHLPQFPFFPAQSISHDYGRTIQPFQQPPGQKTTASPSGHLQPQPSNFNLEGRSPPVQNGRTALAPYQRTGDPFSQGQQAAGLRSSIPPANQLQAPRLNAHSSALLQIFKSEAPAIEGSRSELAPFPTPKSELPASTTPSASTSTSSSKPTLPHGLSSFNRSIRPALASPLFDGPLRSVSKPRLPQQKALLDLFKTPPPAMNITTPVSQAVFAPVELAAHPSSAHPRFGSQALQPSALIAPMDPPLINGKVTIQKRPDSIAGSKKLAVSATVTGPLHVPQFESILKRAPEIQGNDAKQKSQNIMPPIRAEPIRILPRPSAIATTGKPSGKHSSPESRNKPKASAQRKSTTEHKASPKPFHPQILKRAPVALAPPQPAPKIVQQLEPYRLSPVLLAETPMNRQASQTKEHKLTLLSLFSKPTILNQVQAPGKETISPMSDIKSSDPKSTIKPQSRTTTTSAIEDNLHRSKMNNAISASRNPSPQAGHHHATAPSSDLDLTPKIQSTSTFPLAAGRPMQQRFGSVALAFGAPQSSCSRQGSVVSGLSLLEEGQAGRRTPRTAASDKQFLLGFLDGVTRGLR